jgi:hypothetical protein
VLANDTHIWCGECQEVVPLIRDFMPAGGANDHAATDLLCEPAHHIVATIHHRPGKAA